MKRQFGTQIRRQSWAIAVLILIAFSLLGFGGVGIRSLFKGFDVHWPFATRFGVTYGPVAFPVFGIVAGTTLILSDFFVLHRWVQRILIFCLHSSLFGLLKGCLEPYGELLAKP